MKEEMTHPPNKEELYDKEKRCLLHRPDRQFILGCPVCEKELKELGHNLLLDSRTNQERKEDEETKQIEALEQFCRFLKNEYGQIFSKRSDKKEYQYSCLAVKFSDITKALKKFKVNK